MKLCSKNKMNKKAQFESKLYAIIWLLIVGVLFLFFNRFNDEFYGKFDAWFEDTAEEGGTNYSEAKDAVSSIRAVENSGMWDYAFLAIFLGFMIQIVLFSFATRIHIAFFWIMVLMDLPLLVLGVIVSNVWQELAANPEFATSIVRFPITNLLLGTYFPMSIAFLTFISSIILFGKKPGVDTPQNG